MNEEHHRDEGFRERRMKVFDACPHCGRKLSPWEQVLLSVDRTLMCNQCWYRIILDVKEDPGNQLPNDKPKG